MKIFFKYLFVFIILQIVFTICIGVTQTSFNPQYFEKGALICFALGILIFGISCSAAAIIEIYE